MDWGQSYGLAESVEASWERCTDAHSHLYMGEDTVESKSKAAIANNENRLSTQAQLLFANKKTQTYVIQQKNKVVNKVLSTIISSRDENQSEFKNLICFVFFLDLPHP